ncbi:hypothetical protein K1719_041484 [Acacia pycnantha]|nr:hypothetical protein K1719_041484 [Acacia pycnantha]
MPTAVSPLASRLVAVIGAGAGGLVAARELRREGHRVVVFERGDQVGGTWIYNPKVESDPLGTNPDRAVVHSSLYQSLRTNLPREVMGFRDYPFVKREGDGRDGRRFPGHKEVLMYLQDFAAEFGINELVRFETEVVSAKFEDGGKWKVTSKRRSGDGVDEIYDALVVCNGHFTQPRISDIPGIKVWPGSRCIAIIIVHLTPFKIKLWSVADDKLGKLPGFKNVWLHSMIDSVHEDGRVVFNDGNAVYADVILHCTGYKYDFPFLEANGAVTVDDHCVEPLYKHVFPPALAPWLSFVGIPVKVVPLIMCELQSKWIAGILSNRIALPSEEEMMEDVKALYSSLETSGTPKRYAHYLAKGQQWDYNNWVAAQCGVPPVEEWRQKMYMAASKSRALQPSTYRDHWEDDDLVLEAQQDFGRCL